MCLVPEVRKIISQILAAARAPLPLGRSCRGTVDREECRATGVSNFAQTRHGLYAHSSFFLKLEDSP
jgi:hypothetical protein